MPNWKHTPTEADRAVWTCGWCDAVVPGGREGKEKHDDAAHAADNGWRFNGDYDDLEQVRPFWQTYVTVHDEVTEHGGYPYNASFKWRIPAIFGPDEDTAIYLLQSLRHLREHQAKVLRLIAEGYTPLESLDVQTRFASIANVSDSGQSINVYDDARLVPRDGRPSVILPKGKRTHGFRVGSRVLVR